MDGAEFLRIVEQQRNSLGDESSSKPAAEWKDNIEESMEDSPTSTAPFHNMSVVFSGSLANDISRQTAQELAMQLGATSTPSQVTKSTGLLVVGSKAAMSKVTKAETLGIQIMDAEAFLHIVEANSSTT
jgi:NAD-dependent DNA ligase